MKYKKIILAGELIGVLATVLIALKIIFLEPKCFSLSDGYTTILPIIFTKIVETISILEK